MDLGNFSLGLNVKDINKSIQFYTSLGFEIIDGGHVNETCKDSETIRSGFIKTKNPMREQKTLSWHCWTHLFMSYNCSTAISPL